ncbi:MAG: hypothetical protein JW918_01020 [Anaerolineae bacterium]|nr:hypothetical protein [Anaerolineae bacterium]
MTQETDQNHDEKGQFTEGNRANLRHGGESAVKAIQRGEPLTGLAAQAEADVYTELDTKGRPALVIRNAARLQAATDLYWNAIQAVADQGNLEMLDKYVKRFGWLAGASLRAWESARKESAQGDDGLILDAMAAAKDAKGGA